MPAGRTARSRGRSQLEANGWQYGIGAGLIWEPERDKVWLGLSYTSKPNIAGGMTMNGTLRNVFATGSPTSRASRIAPRSRT